MPDVDKPTRFPIVKFHIKCQPGAMHVEVATDERGDSAFVENFMCALAE